MNPFLPKWIFVLCFIGVSVTTFAQTIEIVRYRPVKDLVIGKNDSLDLKLPDSVFYEKNEAPLTYEASRVVSNASEPLPTWLTFKTSPLSFGGRPSQANIGTYQIVLKATSGAVSSTDTFKIDVINQAPIVSVPLSGLIFTKGFASAQVDISKTFSDKDNDPLTYTVTNSATDVVTASLTANTITLTEVGIGSAEITVTAKDNQEKTVTNSFTVITRKVEEVFGFTTENTGSNGLVESWVRSIHVENNNEIWMGTDMGLSLFKPTTNAWTTVMKGGNRDDGRTKIIKILKSPAGAKVLLVLRGLQLASESGYTYYDRQSIPELGDFVNSGAFDSNGKLWLVVSKANILYLVRLDITTRQVELSQQLFSTFAFNRSMAIDAQNNPWIATNKGLVHYETSGLTVYDHTNGLPKDDVFNVAYKDGKVYFVQEGSVGIYNGTNFSKLSYDKIFNANDNALTIDAKGDIWTSSLTYGILHYNATTGWQSHKLNFLGNTFSFDYPIYDINIDALNRVWVATRWGVLLYPDDAFPPGTPTIFNTYDGLPSNDVYRILKDDKGNVWFPTNINGVSKYDGQNWTWTYRTVPFEAAIWLQNTTAAYVAKNGAIWLGGAGGISTSTDGNTWKSFISVDYNAPNAVLNMNNVMAIGEDASKNIWVGGVGYTTNMGLNKYNGTSWSTYKVADGLKGTSIKVLFGDSKGNMWIAYNSLASPAVTKIASDGTMTHFANGPTNPDFGYVEQILETADGKIWVATFYGIGVFDGTTWNMIKSTNGLRADQISQMTIDGLGNVWVSYYPTLKLGVSMYDGTKWQHFNKQNGLTSDEVNSLQVMVTSSGTSGGRTMATGGTLWLGTPNDGVSRLSINGFLGLKETEQPKPEPPKQEPPKEEPPKQEPPKQEPPVVTGVDDNEEGMVLYPIPVDEVVYLRINSRVAGETTISIMDVTGRTWREQLVETKSTVEIPVGALKPGMYFIQWKDAVGVHRKRFLKTN